MRKRRRSARGAIKSKVYAYTTLFEPAAEGGYTVSVPMLPAVITEGDNLQAARARVKEAVRGYLKVLRKRGEAIPYERGTRLEHPITERVAVVV